MNWKEYLRNCPKLRSIYGEDPHEYDYIDLHEIIFNRDGPSVILRCDLPTFPTNPPAKWMQAGFNKVQVRLWILGITSASLEGWVTSGMCTVDLIFEDGSAVLKIDSDGVRARFIAPEIYIESISAYHDARKKGTD
ncbi:Imm50 family immunity protein [Stutzerimonas nosocomialis]|uniref:Imm50 family immunity protein n=1 Tax=Stutzerimonas nosocomialis TaxID=1056496 RepID=UPI0013053AEB|nr:Imm50 family immunity protein [Stutzerimonas nosocomialis]